jgi:hypothetical protein
MDIPADLLDGDWDDAQAALTRGGLTDGLPVVPPTHARVEAMLRETRLVQDEVVCVLPPSFTEVTWRDIAINAVMAGCAGAYAPVIGAAIEAMASPEFNLLGIATTTGSATVCVIVNGPIAGQIGMNAGANAFGRAIARMPRSGALCA